ncbi:MAG: DUF3881 family protein [Lachnospiraceae bacterium]
MHQYIKAIGFSTIKTKREIKKIVQEVRDTFSHHELVSLEQNIDFCEYRKEYGENIGISVYGETDEYEQFECEYYIPYFRGTVVSSYGDIIVDRRIDREEYVGTCEDVKVGVSLIFHLQNGIEYMREKQLGQLPKSSTSVMLSGMALSGMILFPVQKNEEQVKTRREESRNRMMLLSAAKDGDQAAIEILTLEDIDTYAQVSERLITEDVFSIVDTYFMPYGVECDQYSILGEILKIHKSKNQITNEQLYMMTLDVNELELDVCVPVNELLGEPQIGRRFKGNIWLQGYINF